jgi:hypothetical protein
MHRLRGCPEVQQAGCRTLWLVSAVEAALPAMVAAGAIPTVVAAMVGCPVIRNVQCDGSRLLSVLSGNPADCIKIVQAGGHAALRCAAQRFNYDADVAYYTRLALRGLDAAAPPAPRKSTPPMPIPRPPPLRPRGSASLAQVWDSVEDLEE